MTYFSSFLSLFLSSTSTQCFFYLEFSICSINVLISHVYLYKITVTSVEKWSKLTINFLTQTFFLFCIYNGQHVSKTKSQFFAWFLHLSNNKFVMFNFPIFGYMICFKSLKCETKIDNVWWPMLTQLYGWTDKCLFSQTIESFIQPTLTKQNNKLKLCGKINTLKNKFLKRF